MAVILAFYLGSFESENNVHFLEMDTQFLEAHQQKITFLKMTTLVL